MIDQYETKNLFQLQTELIDRKVDMAAANAMEKVISRIDNMTSRIDILRSDAFKAIDDCRIDMLKAFEASRIETAKAIEASKAETVKAIESLGNRVTALEQSVSSLGNRMVAVETKLGLLNERNKEIRNRFFDYSFKAGWLALSVLITYSLLHVQIFSKL